MRYLFFSIFLLVTCLAPAQILDWGNAQKIGSRNYFCKYIGYNNDGYYYLRSKRPDFKSDITIEKYGLNLNLLWSKNVGNDRSERAILEVVLLQNKLLVFLKEDDYASGFTDVKSISVSFDGAVELAATTLFQTKLSAFFNEDGSDRYTIKTNEEKSEFMFGYVLQSEKNIPTLNYNVFAENGSYKASGGYAYTIKVDQFYINDLVLNNNFIYVLISYNEPKKTDINTYYHDVLSINSSTQATVKTPVVLEGKIQSDLGIYLDTANQSLQLTGFYSEKKSTSAAGIAVYTMPLSDPSKYNVAFTAFPKALLAKIIGERASERTKEVEDFVVNRIVPRSDGGILLIAECFYIEKQPYNNYTSGIQGAAPQPTIIRSVYNYDEVLVISIEPDSKIDWWQVITKNQNSVNDEGYNLSIATMVKKEIIYVFFNVGYRNNNDIMEYSISSNGKMKNRVLFKSTSYYIDFTPRQSAQIASGSVLMPLVKDRKFNLLKITY